MDPAVEVRLVELRGLDPGCGPDRLRYRLGREGVEPVPSRAAIGRALVRLGLVRPGRRRAARREYRRWERGRPMELWQLDVMGGVRLADGGELKAVTASDDHSRPGPCPEASSITRDALVNHQLRLNTPTQENPANGLTGRISRRRHRLHPQFRADRGR
jgi:hypothetical protein